MNRPSSVELPLVTSGHITAIKAEIDRRLAEYETTPEPVPGESADSSADSYRQFVEGLQAKRTALDHNPLIAIAHFQRIRSIVRHGAEDEDTLILAKRVHDAVPEALQLAAAVSMLVSHEKWSFLVDPLSALRVIEEEARRTRG